ncbi:hypothetical protein MG293_016042 [Ovis ammon polii]|uniref:Chemokine interleukin-8-like domain-containing protein n=1 Tax=Ovis ammon polii TaxID=230172 RepID=A0AAD4Y3A1_OVIAM|nr:hypothetical protein MG293_016042 [Ovis ammon polii]
MKVLVAAVFVLCAVALCSCAQKKVYTPPTCCFTYASGKIPQGNVVNYFKTSSDCPKSGIISVKVKNKFCNRKNAKTQMKPQNRLKPTEDIPLVLCLQLAKRSSSWVVKVEKGIISMDEKKLKPKMGFHRPTDCCMSYTPRNIRCVFMEDYIETSSACSRPAVIYNFLKDIFSKVKGH